jgi:hypothetical protein
MVGAHHVEPVITSLTRPEQVVAAYAPRGGGDVEGGVPDIGRTAQGLVGDVAGGQVADRLADPDVHDRPHRRAEARVRCIRLADLELRSRPLGG